MLANLKTVLGDLCLARYTVMLTKIQINAIDTNGEDDGVDKHDDFYYHHATR